MSDYTIDDSRFVDNNLDERKKYECPECHFLLEDAVQTSCGHWFCHKCASGLFERSSSPVCPRTDCGEVLEVEGGNQFFPDKFVRKEINKFQVRCRNHSNNCPWTGTIAQHLKHVTNCAFEQEECPHCCELFAKNEFQKHELNCPKALMHCPFKELGCDVTKQMTRAECDQHLHMYGVKHSKIIVSLLPKLNKMQQNESRFSNIALVRGPKGNASPPESWGAHQHVEADGGGPTTRSQSVDVEFMKKQLSSKESQIRHLQDKVQQLEATMQAKTTENEDRDFRLSLMENSNYDGTMLWKIPQFSQRMDDARTGKYTSIFSLPFYSGRYGYKMCLRLYIMGDGIGKGSHMSLFFVLMKGEFDNILQWPFNHKVTFKLINQCGGRDVVDVFQPDPLSSSFQKPKTDMNIASGCPRFVSLNELLHNGFIVDDTLFIKVKVDTTTMKQP